MPDGKEKNRQGSRVNRKEKSKREKGVRMLSGLWGEEKESFE